MRWAGSCLVAGLALAYTILDGPVPAALVRRQVDMNDSGIIALVFEPGPSTAPAGVLGRDSDTVLLRLLGTRRLSIANLSWAMLVSFFLGALHALGPGHGKSVAAAYLVGSRATMAHAFALGAVLTAAHIGSVLCFGVIALWAAERFVSEQMVIVLEVSAGLGIMILGLVLLISRLRKRRRSDHDHNHVHIHDHEEKVSLGAILTLGITSGIVPCPAAIVVLLYAIAVGRIALGLVLIIVFSFGLACVLMGIGVLAVRARSWLVRFDEHGAIARHAPVISAVLVTLLGVALALEPLWHHS